MRTVLEFFAHQLNVHTEGFERTVEALEAISGKRNVLEEFYEENHEKVKKILSRFKMTYPNAEEVFEAKKKDIQRLDKEVFKLLDEPVCDSNEGCADLISSVIALHPGKSGFFLKRKVAQELLKENPPKNIMKELGYDSVEKMIEEEDLFEIYAALRFLEDREWLNSTYISAYRNLTKDDFEIRPIEIRILERQKWQKVTEAFVHKKMHPMSHLKEMGIIFLVPSDELTHSLTLYLFGMTSHYLDEVNLYSNYFKYHSTGDSFGDKVVSAIRGDVPDISISKNEFTWLIIQRYLFKENPDDPRLGTPHINPEALYHRGASHALLKLEKYAPVLKFDIWTHTNYLGVWFPEKGGKEKLVNFNLMDSIMDVMNNRTFSERYNYHFHEALWNKIFINFFGVDKMEDTIIKHLLDGWFDIRKI